MVPTSTSCDELCSSATIAATASPTPNFRRASNKVSPSDSASILDPKFGGDSNDCDGGEKPASIEDAHEQVSYLPWATCVFSAIAALNSCNLGYDIGVNTAAVKKLQNSMGLTDVQVELAMGILDFVAIFGALGSHLVTDRLGRRAGFLVSSCVFIVGVLISSLSPNYAVLMVGRAFVALGIGFGLAVDPLYIAEICPPEYRGRLVTWGEIGTNVGIVIGFMSGLFFYNVESDNLAWRGMFLLGLVMPLVLIVLVLFVLPESPRWLVQKGRDDDAVAVLQRVYPREYDVDGVVENIKENIRMDTEAEHAVGWGVIFRPSPAFRRMLTIGVGTAIAQQAVGIDGIQYFLVYILDESGIKDELTQLVALVGLGLIKLVFIVIAGRAFDRRGRRPLFFLSCAGMFASLLVLSINFYVPSTSGPVAIAFLALYLMFFSLGMGPGAWLIPSEVFSLTIRAKAMSVATTANRLTSMIMGSTFLSTAHAMSFGGFFLLLAIICGIVAAFFYCYLPETKGRSLEDMSRYFARMTNDQSILELEERLAETKASVRAEGQA